MLERLLITGASGNLGKIARAQLKHMARTLRLSDVSDPGPAGEGEETVVCDLGDERAVNDLVAGCDGIIHFGGVSVEDRFDKILNANIQGVYNLYEAARANGMPRILFASSNHATGFYKQDTLIDGSAPFRPDGLYGVSKCFGEAIAKLYFDKFGQETARVRIGACFPKPRDHRMMPIWLSADDLVSLIECIFRVPRLGCPVVYGMSANDCTWWDNSAAAYLGWHPKDNSEAFRAEIDAAMQRPDKDAVDAIYQGGKFCADTIHR